MENLYGTKAYYEQAVELATLKAQLIKEAVAVRLTSGQITADNLGTYAEIIEQADNGVKYAVKELEEKYPSENAENGGEDAQ